ncbi:MAP7 domain-containing protein 2 [Chanos chanos]|uniref:MAP7 domain-containing protein 2 n=1 Tax=Chanos chanos TaxID=29144 RepID=A0A6J2UUJ5_CHACN|nr:MAP7 domain-containing protein 2-like [Chanos chanos]
MATLAFEVSVGKNTEGSTKKDKAQLARERREEREKIQVLRERAVQEKEQRAQQLYARSVDERGRRLKQQRQKEEHRRLAVEEKRRQRTEEEKERLEALLRRSIDRSYHLEQRPKRWTWGGPAGGTDGDPKIALPPHPTSATLANDPSASPSASQSKDVPDFMIPPESPESILNKRLSSSSATLPNMEKASPSPHRSPYRSSPNGADRRSISTGPREESKEAAAPPKTPQTEKQTGEKGTTPTLTESPYKHLGSPTTPTRSSSPQTQNKNPGTPKRARSVKSRVQSPCSPGQYPPSPMRNRATTPSSDSKRWEGEEKGAGDGRGYSTLERKSSKTETTERKISKSASRDLGDRNADASPVTPTGRSFAGTTDAEEASRLLAERRRLARVQKEQEEKQRAEEERLRAEELERRQAEEQEQREKAARRAEEDRKRQEEERRRKEEEDRRQKERRWKEMQEQLDREREEAILRAQREAERKRQEREILKLQEEQERLQRKKRIEEIMKRTRKPDTEPKKEEVPLEPPFPVSMVEPVSSSVEMVEISTSAVMKANESLISTTTEPSIINLVPLDAKTTAADDLSDGVQSMDVSPVSRDDLISIQESSPGSEVSQSRMSNTQTLEDLLVLAGQASFPKVTPSTTQDDCNRNLIQGFSSAAADSQLIQSLGPTSDKLRRRGSLGLDFPGRDWTRCQPDVRRLFRASTPAPSRFSRGDHPFALQFL